MEDAPQNPPQTQNREIGRIYCISCRNTGLKYYGSTTLTIQTRLQYHEANYRYHLKNGNRFNSSFDVLQNGNYEITEIEQVEDILQLKQRERHYVQNNVCVNRNIPSRTTKEYYADNRANLLEHARNYYNANKSRKKQYYEDNKQRLKAQSLQRYYDNKRLLNNNNNIINA